MHTYIKNNKYDGHDHRELIFFAIIMLSVLMKFYFVEFYVRPVITRNMLAVASSVGITMLLFVPVNLMWNRLRPYLAFMADFLLSALAVTDLLYMRYYSDLFSFGNIGLTAQVGEISDSVFALFHPSDIIYFIDIPILFFYIFITRKSSDKPFFKRLNVRRAGISVILILIGALTLYRCFDSYEKKMPGALRSMWDRPAICGNVGAMTYHVADALNIVRDRFMKRSLPQEEINEIRDWLDARSRAEMQNDKMFGMYRGKNLIIIQVESLQQFVIGLKINGEEVTPNINRFVRESVYFSRAYNQTGTGNSSDAEFLVNAALYPSAAGVVYTRFAGNRYEALPKLLAENGYSTLALHGDRPGFWNRQHMYPSLGFQKFISKKDFIVDEKIGLGLSDRSFFRQAVNILDKEPEPFYAFLVTLTSHYPYDFEPIFTQTKFNTGKFKGMLIGNYLTSIHYFDTQFGTFIEELRKKGLLNTSLVIVYGDHPAIPIWDRTNIEKLLGRDLSSDWAWREVQKIPLIIRMPGTDGGRAFRDDKTPVGLIDVSETVSGLLGFRFVPGLGYDLFVPRAKEPVIFRNSSYITGNAFVEPSKGTATDIRSGKQLKYEDFKDMTDEVVRRLGFSDKILGYDLIPKLLNTEAER